MRRRHAARVFAASAAFALTVAACGGDGATDDASVAPANADAPQSADESDVLASRSGAGIAAAGGDVALLDGEECSSNNAIRIAYVGPDLAELGAIGLESLVLEEPAWMIDAYLSEVNAQGGIAGRCVASSTHLWSWANPADSFDQVCNIVPTEQPIVVLNLFGDVRGVQCLAIDAGLPMIGLYASVPATVQRRSRGRLFLDDGTAGYLLANGIDVALHTQIFAEGAQVGLLYGPPAGSTLTGSEYNVGADFKEVVSLTGGYDLIPGVITHVPVAFGNLANLGAEGRVRLLEDGLTSSEINEASNEFAALPPAQTAALHEIEQFYIDAATEHQQSGVVAVFATTPWFELRRMMRAAQKIGWHPIWIATDIQGATLTLTGAPASQVGKFYLVSSRRAPGDVISELDRGCVGLRNSPVDAPTFSHRHHTDAWSLLVATCDALDVTMSALTRAEGRVAADTFVEQLAMTDYEPGFGGRFAFSPGDFSGADRFRVLRADPDCVLDEWGCMRAVTEWYEPSSDLHEDER